MTLPAQKTILITGSTHGIGEAAAFALAGQGHRILLHGRSRERGERVCADLRQKTGNQDITLLTADLSDLEQVRALARQVYECCSRLDVLVNNAGSFFLTRQFIAGGIEMTWAVNHLSYFILTLELLKLLKDSAPARIINVSSNTHLGKNLRRDLLQRGPSARGLYWGYTAYGQSKLANILFTYELARRLEGQAVTANALHPGVVYTNIGRNNGILSRFAQPLIMGRGVTPQVGAQTTIYLAVAPEVEGVSGKYFVRCQPASSSPQSYDPETAILLWQASEVYLSQFQHRPERTPCQ
jgi:retinol dehydrogenase 12